MLLQGHIDCGDAVACLGSHACKGTAQTEVLHQTSWAVGLLLQAVLEPGRAAGHIGWQAVLPFCLQHTLFLLKLLTFCRAMFLQETPLASCIV